VLTAFHLAIELAEPVTTDAFRAAFARDDAMFVLEGGGSTRSDLDRASYMGAAPSASLRARRSRARDARGRVLTDVVTTDGGVRTESAAVDPFAALRDFLSAHAAEADAFDERYPFPFRAGLVGYIGYECGQALERLPSVPRPSAGLPDMALGLHRWIIATSRATTKSWLSILGVGATRAEARADADAIRARVEARLAARGPAPTAPEPRPSRTSIEPGLSADAYKERVAIAKAHIAAGDAFEICLTNVHRTGVARERAWPLFEELLRSNPAPFAAYLALPEGVVVSSSPERFLSLDAHGVAESRPIKGTRPRGRTPDEDERMARELAGSEKDRAENAMIVDLARNDLGRACRFGSVTVPELFVVEPYATVHQLVSTVRGELARGMDGVDLLRACFPPGSMTGAPKIEAMTILERLEPAERGVYSGALGWIDLGGAMDLSVVIRTVVFGEGGATFSVGGAVVADSDPQSELDEARQKAFALVRALEAVGRAGQRPPAIEARP
jgi:aminodeoxychorismate synthase component I